VTTLSTHVLDVERGSPAAGVPIELRSVARTTDTGGVERSLARASTNADGRIADLAGDVPPGAYRLMFEVAAYFAAQSGGAPFLQRVCIDFEVHAADRHCHVPLLLSRYACTSYRGS
jgi:5-hydroxyisourate hydrolase